jgi:hypothetical protein
MEKTKLISLKTSIKSAFEKLFENSSLGFSIKGYIAGIVAIMIVTVPLTIILALIMRSLANAQGTEAISIIVSILTLVFAFGLMAFYSTLFTLIAIKIHNKDFVPMKALWKESLKKAPKFFALTLISSIAITLGYILLIVPGVILTICFMFAPYILLNENTGVFEALKKSRALVKGYKLALYGRGALFATIMLVLIVPLFFLMYAMGQLIMLLFGLFTSLLILEFYEDLKGKQGELAVSGDGENSNMPVQSEPTPPTKEMPAPEAPMELPDLPEPNASSQLPDLPEPTKPEELPNPPESAISSVV